MVISEEQASEILAAFDKLQLEDMLSKNQWLCAVAILDSFPNLSRDYSYLRDPYNEKELRKQESVDPSQMGPGLHPGSEA